MKDQEKEGLTMGENSLMGGGMSPADVRAVMGNGDNWGNNGIWWLAILWIAMMNGGWGWGNNGYQPQFATQDFVQNGFNFNDLQDQNRDLMAAITAGTAQSVGASNQVFHDLYSALGDKYNELQRDIASLAVGQANQLAKQNECCCQQLRAIDQVNFNIAMQAAETQKAVAFEGQATRAMMQQDKIDALQQQVNGLGQALNTQRLEGAIAAATAGVVRYPDTFAYNAGNNPFCGCGQQMGCCNI